MKSDEGITRGLLRERAILRTVSLTVAVMMTIVLAAPLGLAGSSGTTAARTYVVVAVGDIAGSHLPGNNVQRMQYDEVAKLIEDIAPSAFLALGDLQHEDGLLQDYLAYYDSAFAPLMGITYPVPGNHDYYWDGYPTNNFHSASNGSGYFGYFGARLAQISNDPNTLKYGFYSFDIGTSWHLIALNSPLVYHSDITVPGSPAYMQFQWLKSDLRQHSHFPGIIVYFHHPLFDWEVPSSPQGTGSELVPIWDLMVSSGVDIVLNGHAHNYQRWAPQDTAGIAKADGPREFIVGTGGYYLNNLGNQLQPANFVTGQDQSFGALKLTLGPDCYSFEFDAIDGSVMDSGTVACA